MWKKRFTLAQIGVLKKAEVGVPEAAVIRKAGISEQTFYRWKAKYGSGGRPGSPDGTVARREFAVEAVGGRADIGQDGAAGM